MIVGLKHGPEVLVKQYGEELGRRMFDTSIDANRYVEELITREGLDCGVPPCRPLYCGFQTEGLRFSRTRSGVFGASFRAHH